MIQHAYRVGRLQTGDHVFAVNHQRRRALDA
jgi:hypothetical protein